MRPIYQLLTLILMLFVGMAIFYDEMVEGELQLPVLFIAVILTRITMILGWEALKWIIKKVLQL